MIFTARVRASLHPDLNHAPVYVLCVEYIDTVSLASFAGRPGRLPHAPAHHPAVGPVSV